MKKIILILFLGALAPSLALAIGRNVLKNFNGASDGDNLWSGLIYGSDGNLYGTACSGGAQSSGVFFKIEITNSNRSAPTSSFTVLHDFGDSNVTDDGVWPQGKLVQDGSGYIYGTTMNGGYAYFTVGTVYQIDPSNGSITTIHTFSDGSYSDDGVNPCDLVRDGSGNIYGVTQNTYGLSRGGTIFKLTPSGGGWSYSVIYRFPGGYTAAAPCSLTLGSDGKLYGTALLGGSNDTGLYWRFDPSNSTFTKLLDISTNGATYFGLTQVPIAFTSGAMEFWGTTPTDGTYGYGTVFKIAETYTGSGLFTYSVMHNFANAYNNAAYPGGDLLFSTDIGSSDSGGVFYGMTAISENVDPGSVFRIDLSGNYSEPLIGQFYGGGYQGGTLVRGVMGGVPVLFGAAGIGGTSNHGAVFEAYLQ
jgi:hypothetical protein